MENVTVCIGVRGALRNSRVSPQSWELGKGWFYLWVLGWGAGMPATAEEQGLRASLEQRQALT